MLGFGDPHIWNKVTHYQCDQIGRFIGLWASIQSLWPQLIYPNLLHSSAIFVKVSKSWIFLVKSFLGNFYGHLVIFYWSHWLLAGFERFDWFKQSNYPPDNSKNECRVNLRAKFFSQDQLSGCIACHSFNNWVANESTQNKLSLNLQEKNSQKNHLAGCVICLSVNIWVANESDQNERSLNFQEKNS